jgi:PadR family transcriptional regulator PadR
MEPRILLLQALLEGEGFGLELGERIEQRSGGRSRLPQGQVYPTLRALERQGLVTSRIGETTAARKGRPRVYYALTAEGRRAALEDQETARGIFGFAGTPASAWGKL